MAPAAGRMLGPVPASMWPRCPVVLAGPGHEHSSPARGLTTGQRPVRRPVRGTIGCAAVVVALACAWWRCWSTRGRCQVDPRYIAGQWRSVAWLAGCGPAGSAAKAVRLRSRFAPLGEHRPASGQWQDGVAAAQARGRGKRGCGRGDCEYRFRRASLSLGRKSVAGPHAPACPVASVRPSAAAGRRA